MSGLVKLVKNLDSTTLSNYASPETGATTRTIASKLADIISVKDFGAVGDGTTDDTSAIQAAIDSLPNETTNQGEDQEGGQIYFPPGIYKITSSINVGTNDRSVELIGSGRGNCIINIAFDGVGINVTGTDTGSGYTKRFTIRNFKFQSTSVDRPSGSYMVQIKYSHYFTIDNCWFQGEAHSAIYIGDALDGYISNCEIDTAASDNVGFYNGIYLKREGVIGAPNQITIFHCYVEDCFYSAIRVEEGEEVTIMNSLIQSNERYGIIFDECNSLSIKDCYFEANGQDNTANTGDIFDSGGNLSRNVTIKENHFSLDGSSNTFYVCYLTDCRGASFSNNDLRGGSAQNIRIGSSCKAITVRENTATVDPLITNSTSVSNLRATNNRLVDGAFWANIRETDLDTYYDSSSEISSYPETVTPDRTKGKSIDYGDIAGDVTINAVSNVTAGDCVTITYRQDATGGRTVTWNSAYRISTSANTAAYRRHVYTFIYNGSQFIEQSATTDAT